MYQRRSRKLRLRLDRDTQPSPEATLELLALARVRLVLVLVDMGEPSTSPAVRAQHHLHMECQRDATRSLNMDLIALQREVNDRRLQWHATC